MSSSNSSPMYKIFMDDPLDLRKGAEVHVDFSHAMDKVKLLTDRMHEINVKLLRTMKWGFDLVVQRRQRRAAAVLDEIPSPSLFKRGGKKGVKKGGKKGGRRVGKKGGKKEDKKEDKKAMGINNDSNGGMVSKKTTRKSTRSSGRSRKDKRQPSKEEGENDKQLSKTAKGAKEDEQPEVNQDRT